MTRKPRRSPPKNHSHGGWESSGSGYLPFAPFELSQTVAVLTQAVESNERQIHDVAQTSAQNIKELSILIEKQGTQTNSRLEALANNFQTSQRPNYMLWVAAIAVLFTFIGAAAKITDLQTQVILAPVSSRAEVSEKDRSEIHQNIKTSTDAITNLQTAQKVNDAKLVEIETQFRASDRARNVQFAEQQRTNNLQMQIGQGAGTPGHPPIVYPAGPFYFPETTGDGANAPH